MIPPSYAATEIDQLDPMAENVPMSKLKIFTEKVLLFFLFGLMIFYYLQSIHSSEKKKRFS